MPVAVLLSTLTHFPTRIAYLVAPADTASSSVTILG